jgi:hypothetical protein
MRLKKYLRLTVTTENNRQTPNQNDGPSAGPPLAAQETIKHLTTDLTNWSELYTDPTIKRMNTEQTIEDRLWDYIDGISNPAERSAIDELLAANFEWRQKYRELLNVHQLLNTSELEAPSMRFTKNVMEEIARHHVAPATKTYINKNIIRGIGAFFLTMIVGFVTYVLAQFNWFAAGAGSSKILPTSPNLNLERLNNLNVSKAFNSTYITVFMLILVVMGFMLLDMYLQRKKEKQSTT